MIGHYEKFEIPPQIIKNKWIKIGLKGKEKELLGKKLEKSKYFHSIKNQFKDKKLKRDNDTYLFLKKLLKQLKTSYKKIVTK